MLACAGTAGLGTCFANGETADAEGNPYAVISDRNIFHLNPPPPPPPIDPPKPSDTRKVMLSGFLGKGNSTRALMAIVPKDTKEPTRYLNLAPGERKDDVELVSIRLKEEEVDIVNEGTAMLLSVKSNSFASTATAPPPAAGAPEKPGRGGFQRPISPAFQRSMPVAPAGGPAAPVAAAAPGGGGAIIIGGGNSGSQMMSPNGGTVVSGGSQYGGGAGSQYGGGASSSYGGSIVTGGSGVSGYANNAGAYANNAGVQVGSLFNSQTGAYQKALPTVAPAPPEVQAVTLAAQAAAGGPPAPPIPGMPGGPPVPR